MADASTSLLLVAAHGAVIMVQGMAFSVAMHSKRANALVALLIASNFAEIKGVVLKRFDARRLFILSCQVCCGGGTAHSLCSYVSASMVNNGTNQTWQSPPSPICTCTICNMPLHTAPPYFLQYSSLACFRICQDLIRQNLPGDAV